MGLFVNKKKKLSSKKGKSLRFNDLAYFSIYMDILLSLSLTSNILQNFIETKKMQKIELLQLFLTILKCLIINYTSKYHAFWTIFRSHIVILGLYSWLSRPWQWTGFLYLLANVEACLNIPLSISMTFIVFLSVLNQMGSTFADFIRWIYEHSWQKLKIMVIKYRKEVFFNSVNISSQAFNQECIICLDEKDTQYLIILNCGHSYHQHCLKKWCDSSLIKNNCCPICRRKLF